MNLEKFSHRKNVPLKELSTYRPTGIAEIVFYPQSVDELLTLIMEIKKSENPDFWISGYGANTLFTAEKISTKIISTKNLDKIEFLDDRTVFVESGVVLDKLITTTLHKKLSGLQLLSGIPSSIGGAIFMNAGAYNAEISDFIVEVTIFKNGEIKTLKKDECGFSYRNAESLKNSIILSAKWKLNHDYDNYAAVIRSQTLATRKEKQPLEFPSCGSVFKRPENNFASALIDKAGLKGKRCGDAMVSEKHAGFIVNVGNASNEHILELIEICRNEVKMQFGIDLELEQQTL